MTEVVGKPHPAVTALLAGDIVFLPSREHNVRGRLGGWVPTVFVSPRAFILESGGEPVQLWVRGRL